MLFGIPHTEKRRWEATNRILDLSKVFKVPQNDIMVAGGFARDMALQLEPTDIDIYMFTPNVKEETFLTAFIYAAFDDVDDVVEKSADKPGYVNSSIYKVYGVTFTDKDVLPLDIIFIKKNPLDIPELKDAEYCIKEAVLPFGCNMSNAYLDKGGRIYVEEDFLEGALNKTVEHSPMMMDSYRAKLSEISG